MDTFLNIDRIQVNHLFSLPPVSNPVYVTVPSKIPPNLTTTGAGYSMFAPANGNPSNITTGTINATTGNIVTLNTASGNFTSISTGSIIAGAGNFTSISTGSIIAGTGDFTSISTSIGYINTVSSAVLNLDGNVLTTSGADLLLNGIPIATTSNISSITDWALYPAVSTVNFETVGGSGNGQLINVSTINGVAFVNGGGVSSDWSQYPAIQNIDLQNFDLLSTNSLVFNPSGNMAIVGLSTINGVAWVNGGGGGGGNTISGVDTFMTASGVGSGGFNTSAISGSGGLGGFVTLTANAGDAGVSGGNIVITANGGTAPGGVFGRVDVIANTGVSDPGTGAITTGGYVNIQANSGGVTSPTLTSRIDLNAGGLNLYAGIASPITSVEGYAFINALNGVSLVAGTWTSAFQTPGTVYLYGQTGVVMGSDMYATDIYPVWNGLAPPANLSINGRTTVSGNAYVELNNVSTINFEVGQAGALTGVNSINGSAYPPPGTASFVDAYQIYVAPNGNDTTGTGSQQNPFLTIGQAIIFRATLGNSIEVTIVISSGTYNENPTLTRNTYLVGVQTGESRQPCNVTGTITMNDTTGTMGISGLEVVGNVSMTGLGGTYTVFSCNISSSATAVNATTGTVFITECRISNSAGTTLSCASTITIRDCVISTSGTGSCIVASAGTTIRQSVITSSSASTGVSPLVNITNSNPAIQVIEFCRLEYTSTATDVTGNKCCIKFAGAGVATASVSQNLLLCEGAITGSPQIQCIQDTGAGAVNMAYGGLIAGVAHHISPAVTKTAFNVVP